MKKTYMGVRLRRLRAQRGLSQIALAQTLGISASYLNQIEQNQRPLTVQVLLKIHRTLGVDIQQFSEDEETRLVAAMREALADAQQPVTLPELQEVASQMPAVGRALVALHQRHAETLERLQAMADWIGDDRSDMVAPRAMPFERVRDFFFAQQNYFDALDRSAEMLALEASAQGQRLGDWLMERLDVKHGIRVVYTNGTTQSSKRHYDPQQRILYLSALLEPGQQAFQLGTQLALLEAGTQINALIQAASPTEEVAFNRLARIGLANYFAGALLLPYSNFLGAAESLRYDIDLLGQHFGVGLETVCHRLSTLQRPGAPGCLFFWCGSIVLAISPNGNRQRISISAALAVPVRCGMSMRHLGSRGISCGNWRRCPMGAHTFGLPALFLEVRAVMAHHAGLFRLGWDATFAMHIGWSMPKD